MYSHTLVSSANHVSFRYARRKRLRAGLERRVDPPADRRDIPGSLELLARLSTSEYEGDDDTVESHYADARGATHCVICITDFHVGESLTRLPCSHQYHASCIAQWLRSSRHCPLCKADVYAISGVGEVAETVVAGAAPAYTSSRDGREDPCSDEALRTPHDRTAYIEVVPDHASGGPTPATVVNEFLAASANGEGAIYIDQRHEVSSSPISHLEIAC